MDKDQLRGLIERARNETSSYPEYAARLAQGGVDTYHVDVATHTIDWTAGELDYREQADAAVPIGSSAQPFSQDRFVEALRRNQRGESDYPGFLRDSWAAGVVAYDADLRARTVSYHGRDGELYVEAIPAAL